MTALKEYLANAAIPWEGMYFDAWSIAHTLFGFAAACVFSLLGVGAWEGLGATLSIAISWEFGERITNVARIEAATNSVMDIAVALVGYALGAWLIRRCDGQPRIVRIAAMAATALFLGIFALRQLAP